jgi:hypothetical protein
MKHSKLGAVILLLVAMNVAVSIASPLARADSIDSGMPSFEHRLDTEHFVLKWTDRSKHSRDNIKNPQIILETAGYLEQAWAKYTELFDRRPFMPPGRDKMEVVFWDIDSYGIADPPEGPIQFSSFCWVKKRGIRQPTSAHELFHKMQYAYGYKTRWCPKKPYMWFTEGTAAWSEVFVWGRVSRACKVDTLFRDTKMDLHKADDMAMPFWIYFVQGNHEHPNNHLMVKFFEECERLQDVNLALNEVITETYGSVDDFFKGFAKGRKRGFWSGACDAPYRCILGPDGRDVVDQVKCIQRKANKS